MELGIRDIFDFPSMATNDGNTIVLRIIVRIGGSAGSPTVRVYNVSREFSELNGDVTEAQSISIIHVLPFTL